MGHQHKSAQLLVGKCCTGHQVDRVAADKLNVSGTFVFPASCQGFAGHFPGQPILPAVVQLAAVRFLTQCGIGEKVQLCRVERTRFKAIVLPDEPVTIAIRLSKKDEEWLGQFSLAKVGDELVASGTIVVSSDEGK